MKWILIFSENAMINGNKDPNKRDIKIDPPIAIPLKEDLNSSVPYKNRKETLRLPKIFIPTEIYKYNTRTHQHTNLNERRKQKLNN